MNLSLFLRPPSHQSRERERPVPPGCRSPFQSNPHIKHAAPFVHDRLSLRQQRQRRRRHAFGHLRHGDVRLIRPRRHHRVYHLRVVVHVGDAHITVLSPLLDRIHVPRVPSQTERRRILGDLRNVYACRIGLRDGSPGANNATRRRYGIGRPVSSRVTSFIAMLPAITSRFVRCVSADVAVSNAPNIFVLRGATARATAFMPRG